MYFCAAVKTTSYPVGEILIRQMPETRQNSLLEVPGIIVTRLEHVATVIRLDHDRRTTAQAFCYEGL